MTKHLAFDSKISYWFKKKKKKKKKKVSYWQYLAIIKGKRPKTVPNI